MEVSVYGDPEEFLASAGGLLLEDEARHNLIFGIVSNIREGVYPDRRLWVATRGGEPVAAALRTPPYNLIIARPRDDAALEALAAAVDEDIPGVVGARPEVDAFARLWAERRGVEVRVDRGSGVYALERVEPVPRAAGSLRKATSADETLLVEWVREFSDEVLTDADPGRHEPESVVRPRLYSKEGGFVLWEVGGKPVSLAGWGGPTPNGIRIGPVYTPPALRGRGYATTLVAEVSQTLLDRGRRFCFLFTDLANPTSNAVYERIGYVRVCESLMVSFGSWRS